MNYEIYLNDIYVSLNTINQIQNKFYDLFEVHYSDKY